jgi:hypothetical protein
MPELLPLLPPPEVLMKVIIEIPDSEDWKVADFIRHQHPAGSRGDFLRVYHGEELVLAARLISMEVPQATASA